MKDKWVPESQSSIVRTKQVLLTGHWCYQTVKYTNYWINGNLNEVSCGGNSKLRARGVHMRLITSKNDLPDNLQSNNLNFTQNKHIVVEWKMGKGGKKNDNMPINYHFLRKYCRMPAEHKMLSY